MTRWEMYAHTDSGKVRDRNEDSYFVEPDDGILAIADGMSGQNRGDVASEIFVETVESGAEALANSADSGDLVADPDHREHLLQQLTSVFLEANRKIFNAGEGKMGTTADAVVLTGNAAVVAHVGDSRTYLLRDGELNLLTTDHTYAGKTDDSTGSDEQFEHVLTRSLGTHPHVKVDTVFVKLTPGDAFLLCTDGVTNNLEYGAIETLAGERDGEELVDELIARSRAAGGADNATAIICSDAGKGAGGFEEPTSVETTRKLELLGKLGLFEDLEPRTILKLLRHIYTADFDAGEFIIEKGSSEGAMYVLVSGQAAIRRDDRELARIGPGEHVGEMALLDAGPRSADVVAEEDVRALRITREEFWEMVESDPGVGNQILKNMLRHCVERLRHTTEQILVDRHQYSD